MSAPTDPSSATTLDSTARSAAALREIFGWGFKKGRADLIDLVNTEDGSGVGDSSFFGLGGVGSLIVRNEAMRLFLEGPRVRRTQD